MLFCPLCANLLLFDAGGESQFFCQTCPYIFKMTSKVCARAHAPMIGPATARVGAVQCVFPWSNHIDDLIESMRIHCILLCLRLHSYLAKLNWIESKLTMFSEETKHGKMSTKLRVRTRCLDHDASICNIIYTTRADAVCDTYSPNRHFLRAYLLRTSPSSLLCAFACPTNCHCTSSLSALYTSASILHASTN